MCPTAQPRRTTVESKINSSPLWFHSTFAHRLPRANSPVEEDLYYKLSVKYTGKRSDCQTQKRAEQQFSFYALCLLGLLVPPSRNFATDFFMYPVFFCHRTGIDILSLPI